MRTWLLEYTQGSKNWSRIVRADELKIGSKLGNHLRLPAPCPHELVSVQSVDDELQLKNHGKVTVKKDKGSVSFDWHQRTFRVSDITASDRHQPLTLQRLQINRASPIKDPTKRTLWYFYKNRLIETSSLASADPKINQRAALCGFKVELDSFSRKLIVSWPTSDIKFLQLEISETGLQGQSGDHRFLISSAPDLAQLRVPNETKERTRMAPVIFTVMATFLIMLAILQINFSPKNDLMEEVLPAELSKLTLEKEAKSGLPGGGEGGGGVQVERHDSRGGAGIARPDEVLVKNINQLAASAGNLLGALSNLDSKYSAQAAKAAIGPVGVGGSNPSQGILKALGTLAGTGGGGMGIGGIGTKGFGGGGGGGNGLGFGTAAGNGVGEGKDLRAISFESAAGDVRGGLEKSEVEAVIRQNLAQIRNCYNRGLRLNPTLSGKVKASFKITSTGSVELSRIADSTLASSDVEDCIRGRILSWNFPQPRGGSTVDVTYPFLLRPQ